MKKNIHLEFILDVLSLPCVMLAYFLLKFLTRQETRQMVLVEILKKEDNIEDVILVKNEFKFYGVDLNEENIM